MAGDGGEEEGGKDFLREVGTRGVMEGYEREINNLKNMLEEERAKRGGRRVVSAISEEEDGGAISEAEREIREEKEKMKSLVREREREKEVEGEIRREEELGEKASMYLTDSEDEDEEGAGGGEGEEGWEGESPTSKKRRDTMNSHLADLTKSIAVKENLMTQLIQSKSKYNEMRGFYERKLEEMEDEVNRVEGEKRRLEEEMKKEGTAGMRAGLEIKLRDKEEQIRKLRTQKKELVGLTRIESRNDLHVSRLSNELNMMKRQRVELQRRIGDERKHNRDAVMKMKKEVAKGRREGEKWRFEAERMKKDADAAKRISKARLEEVNRTRSKYREAEKRLRMQTLKRGVMARAGLDNVVLGKGDKGGLRDWLDERVSEVCRKEQTAGKLSKEWEERIELMERKDRGEDVGGELREKEGRIRTLSKLMGKGNTRKVELLMSTDFRRLCGGDVGVDEAERGMRNLFGMVVRERKRVMGLASKVKEMERQREEIEGMRLGVKEDKFMLEVEHEKHLASLMMLVSEGEGGAQIAREKIEGMQGRMERMEKEWKGREKGLRDEAERKGRECEGLRREVRNLEEEMKGLRASGAGLNRSLYSTPVSAERGLESSRRGRGGGGSGRRSSGERGERRRWSSGSRISPPPPPTTPPPGSAAAAAAVEANSSDEEFEEVPEWAEDIFKDLETIAEGGVPDVLLRRSMDVDDNNNDENRRVEVGSGKLKVDVNSNTNNRPPTRERKDERGVFQRLMSPSTYTGIHKHRMEKGGKAGGGGRGNEVEEEAVREARMAIEGISPVGNATAYPGFGFDVDTEGVDQGVVRSKKVKDYVNRNVFERLRETETESMMGKKKREARERRESGGAGGMPDGEVKVVKVNLR
jgi:hypothetical protein